MATAPSDSTLPSTSTSSGRQLRTDSLASPANADQFDDIEQQQLNINEPIAAMAPSSRTSSSHGRGGRSSRELGEHGEQVQAQSSTDTTLPVAPSLKGEWANMSLLLLLYFLQGIPIGLSTAVPMLIASKGAGFSAQALFSLAPWPYSLKLLWAPLVDALWTEKWKLGPRKSWVVPVQLATGCVMIILSARINELFGQGGVAGPPGAAGAGQPDVPALTASFFVLYLLVATQDIAVDAWALTMLRPENVGYASTANAVGQSAGVICAGSLFLALESASVADGWIRPALGLPHPLGTGLVTMQGFLATWGSVFLLVTLGLWVGKSEEVGAVGTGQGHGVDRVIERAAVEGAGGRAIESALGAHVAEEPVLHPSTPAAPAATTPTPTPGTGTSATARAGQGRKSRSPVRRVAVDGSTAASSKGLRQRSRGAAGGSAEGSAAAAAGAGAGAGAGEGEAETAPLVPHSPPSTTATQGGQEAQEQVEVPAGHGLRAAWSALVSSYSSFASLLRLPTVLTLALLLVTGKVGWQAVDRGSTLVMQGRGWPKETLASVDAVSSILQLVLQGGVLSRWSAGARPLALYRSLYPARIAGCLALLVCVYLLPTRDPAASSSSSSGSGSGSIPPASLLAYFLLSNLYSTVASLQFMSCMAYFSRLAAGAHAIAGTMVTLCNTLSNLGSSLPGPVALWFVGWATVKGCVQAGKAGAGMGGSSSGGWFLWPGSHGLAPCGTAELDAACTAQGEGYSCSVVQDGFLLASLLGLAYSATWWALTGRTVDRLQGAPREEWRPATAASKTTRQPVPAASTQ